MPDELEVRSVFKNICPVSVHANIDAQERLLSHARAFDGLLSLIPAKLYYGEDVSVSRHQAVNS